MAAILVICALGVSGLVSWFRALGSERSYFEKGTLAVPSMLGPRCEEGPAIEHMKDQHQWNSDGPIPQPESTSIADQILPAEFKAALSKIHISFDLWTSPNKLAMLGVVAYYLSPDLTAKSPMVGLRKLSGNHSSENQAKILLEVAKEFDLASNEILGYFIADNDVAVRIIVKELQLSNPESLRLRCLGHIVNLVCKAFLGSKEDESSLDFKLGGKSRSGLALRQACGERDYWHENGPLAKLHNIIIWIQSTPKRFEHFQNITPMSLTRSIVSSLFPA